MEETLTSLLAAVASGRRWWGRAPQSTNAQAGPYIVLFRISGVPSYHFKGRDLVSSRVQANCYATTSLAAKQTARELVAALEGQNSGSIQSIFIENDGRDLTADDSGGVSSLFAVAVDITVIHSS